MALATLGGLILWLGWFGFNPGSTMEASPDIAHISVTTALAASAGIVGAGAFGEPRQLIGYRRALRKSPTWDEALAQAAQ